MKAHKAASRTNLTLLRQDFSKLSGGCYGMSCFGRQTLRLPPRPEWWLGRQKLAVQAEYPLN